MLCKQAEPYVDCRALVNVSTGQETDVRIDGVVMHEVKTPDDCRQRLPPKSCIVLH